MNYSEMQHQENNKPSSMQPLQNASASQKPRQDSVEETRQLNKLRMLYNAVQSLNSQQEQLENGQTPEALSPEIMKQAQQGANMDAVNKAWGMLRHAA